MKQVIAQALEFAANDRIAVDTGHLLLAITTGQGIASKLLALRGLTESKLRGHLKQLHGEKESIVRQSIEKARQIAAPFKAREPSPLHLLAAMASMPKSKAVRALKDLGMDVTAIRTQALRCLTGVTEEHSSSKQVICLLDKKEALPVAEQLQFFQANLKSETDEQKDPPHRQKRCAMEANTRYTDLSARQLINMGRDLERKQRRKMSMQSGPMTDDDIVDLEAVVQQVKSDRFARNSAFTPSRSTPVSAVKEVKKTKAVTDYLLPADRYPLLSSLGRNLIAEAAEKRLDDIVGRNDEMARVADILNKRKANCPCIVGPAGVGKTALVEGLAARLAKGEAPGLSDRIIVEIRPSDLLSGTSMRGALAERLQQLVQEIGSSNGRVILFFDELQTLLSSSDGAEALQELKASLGRGELPCIAAATDEEYTRFVKSDQTLARRFTAVEIGEPSEAETVQILKGIEPIYSSHHGVELTDEAIEAAVKLSARYVNDRALPDKAIALMDLAGARAKRENEKRVEPLLVASVLAEQLKVPVERLAMTDSEKLLSLESELAKEIIGHVHVLTALGETLRRNAAGFRTQRPIGSFLFLGPTGVGKTETAKALSNFLFPGSNTLVRLDMSEFSEAHAVAKLIGAPPGYVGHEEGGQLTQAIRMRPYSLVLLDEVEKAHPDVLKVLLQVLDDGRLTDGLGRTVVFENTVIVMTSNLGSDLRKIKRQVGFGEKKGEKKDEKFDEVTSSILAGAREALPPELWNRIDEPLVFSPLTKEEVGAIAKLMLEKISSQLQKEHSISIEITDKVIDVLISSGGYDSELGARPMRRVIQRMIEGKVARMILSGELKSSKKIIISIDSGDFAFSSV